jgi:hypothetical protein
MTRAERTELALALEKLRAAESRLAEGVAFGDAHDACVDALALIREAIGPNPPPAEPEAQREAA